jgi:hypothetical protein
VRPYVVDTLERRVLDWPRKMTLSITAGELHDVLAYVAQLEERERVLAARLESGEQEIVIDVERDVVP